MFPWKNGKKQSSVEFTIMQLLKLKLNDVKTLVAISPIHESGLDEAPIVAADFFLIFWQSYHSRQIAGLSIRSTGRSESRSTTCTPSFSIANTFWYVLLLDMIISLSTVFVFTTITALWSERTPCSIIPIFLPDSWGMETNSESFVVSEDSV